MTDISIDVADYHDEAACMEEADSINAATTLLQAVCALNPHWKPEEGADR